MTGDDEAHENAEQHSANKWHDHKPSGLTKAIAALAVYGLFIFIDVHDIWPWSQVAAVIVGILVTIALVYLEAFATGAVGFLAFLICSAAIVVSGAAIYVVMPNAVVPDVETFGALEPGNDPDFPNICGPADSPDAWKIFAGNMAFQFSYPMEVPVLKIGSCDVLTVKKENNHLLVAAKLYDSKGRLLASINDNQFHALSGEEAKVSREHDLSKLIVTDKEGQEIFFVHFMNKSSVRVRGVFGCPGHPTIPVKDGRAIPQVRTPGACVNVKGDKLGSLFKIQ
jgi:hypothetical protein